MSPMCFFKASPSLLLLPPLSLEIQNRQILQVGFLTYDSYFTTKKGCQGPFSSIHKLPQFHC